MTKARGGSEDNKNIEEIREIETKFFERHPFFKSCFSKMKQAGYENLMDRMEQLSLNSMRATLPKVILEICFSAKQIFVLSEIIVNISFIFLTFKFKSEHIISTETP